MTQHISQLDNALATINAYSEQQSLFPMTTFDKLTGGYDHIALYELLFFTRRVAASRLNPSYDISNLDSKALH
ncbi:hypothetical protein O0I10_011980 [Lichtheimia ornata]|uniref:Uncharacterized protein n=1 Tax=Lichtheimia ornata TaxID=688661 RepID=A0AAD7XS37_9FUNG|nr:uncharacterized protein O0I10_011980 [Lichtheimia ornata]KAJ8652400.1 hypothetical protein O0I10_011980 [Lichtheimia ornata]